MEHIPVIMRYYHGNNLQKIQYDFKNISILSYLQDFFYKKCVNMSNF